jgi:hypothetical protein
MPASPDPWPAPAPVTHGGYTLGRELRGGGMSRVFVAREEAPGCDMVVTVLAPALAEGLSAERSSCLLRQPGDPRSERVPALTSRHAAPNRRCHDPAHPHPNLHAPS